MVGSRGGGTHPVRVFLCLFAVTPAVSIPPMLPFTRGADPEPTPREGTPVVVSVGN